MSERLPRVGISCDFELITDRRGVSCPRYLLQESYVTAVVRAGGQPWLLPHLAAEQAASVLDVLDGVVLSGGDFDVPPAYYGEEARRVHGTCEARSAFERALVLAAYERNVPMLGICGGLQIINVALGGSLYQDVSERPGCLQHSQPFDKRRPHHAVNIAPTSLLARITGCEVLEVNSTHHQLAKKVGNGLIASATATDGVIEAIEAGGTETGAGDRRFVLGVQWHPEAMQHEPAQHAIYRSLVRAAREYREGPLTCRGR